MRKSPFLPNRPLKVAILGSSGAVGSELLKILAERDFPISDLILLSSEPSWTPTMAPTVTTKSSAEP